MKRFIAVFGVIVIITMHCLSFYPANAAITSVDYGEMLNTYLGAAETALAASQGVTIDWSNVDLPSGSDTWTDKQKAQYIVQYVGNLKKVGQHAIYEWLFGDDNDTQDVISANTAAIVLSNNSNLNTQDIKAQLDNILATQSQDHVFQRYSDKVIAHWNEYNTNYINKYIDLYDSFYEEVETFCPADYLTRVDKLINFYYTKNNIQYNLLTIPYVSNSNNSLIWDSRESYSYCISSRTGFFNSLEKVTFDINYNENTNKYDLSPRSNIVVLNTVFRNYYTDNPNSIIYNNYAMQPNIITNGVLTDVNYYNAQPGSSTITFPKSYNTLDSAINFLNSYYFCCNLYVNGVLWGYSTNIDQGINISVPDAVIDNSTDDGKIVAHPIYYPDAMNTDKAIDIDLDKVVDAIASRIALGDTDITFDDLVDAGAAVKLDGTTLTDADTIVKDVSVPIARAGVDTIDGVIPTIDVVPPLPPLPPLTPGDYSGEGFNGMSVLARIINATVQGLPDSLILTFFGVVFGAVILGIIKILHH